MKATSLFSDRLEYPDGTILEMILWSVPQPVLGSPHLLKYRLFYGKPGQRLVGYDNERGKGDHRHLEDQEQPYTFTTPEALVADFLDDVKKLRGE